MNDTQDWACRSASPSRFGMCVHSRVVHSRREWTTLGSPARGRTVVIRPRVRQAELGVGKPAQPLVVSKGLRTDSFTYRRDERVRECGRGTRRNELLQAPLAAGTAHQRSWRKS